MTTREIVKLKSNDNFTNCLLLYTIWLNKVIREKPETNMQIQNVVNTKYILQLQAGCTTNIYNAISKIS